VCPVPFAPQPWPHPEFELHAGLGRLIFRCRPSFRPAPANRCKKSPVGPPRGE
jgi:hypothetical protein